MSGGHFDYIDERCKNEIFGWIDDGDRVPNIFEDREISELVYDVFNLIHDYDWYRCGDTGKGTWLERKSDFKHKWLQNRGVRVQRIVDEAIDSIREELYETYGIERKEE